jgi:mannosyltransferase
MQQDKAPAARHANSSPPPAGSRRTTTSLALLVLVAASAVLRFLFLVRKPFWFDEAFSVEVARIDWRNFLHLLWWREANMSLYYVLLRIWLGVSAHVSLHSGQSEYFIRSLSVVAAVATVPAIYWLASLLYDRRVGLIAAALLGFNAYHVRYAQEARSYALFVLLATLSSACLIASLDKPSRQKRAAYVMASVLAAYAHFYALLLVGAHWLALRISRGNRQQASTGAVLPNMRRTWITIGIAVLPLLIFVAKTGAGPIRWIQRPGMSDLVEFWEHLAGSEHWLLLASYAAGCIAAVLPLGTRLFKAGQDRDTWRAQFLLIWLLFPIVLTALLSFARPVFLGRYLIFCLPAFVTLAAAGLARIRNLRLLSAALAGTLALAGQGVLFVYGHDFDNERDGSGAAANYVLDHAEPGDAILFHIAETRVPYEFFRSVRAGENTASPDFKVELGPEIVFPHHADGLDYRDFTGKPTADFLRTEPVRYRRVWVVLMNNGPVANPDPTTVMLSQILTESFPQMRRWQFPRVEVRLYSK